MNTYVVLIVIYALHCPGAAHLLESSVALTITGSNLLASVGDTVNLLFTFCSCSRLKSSCSSSAWAHKPVGVCNGSYSSSLALTVCLLLLVGFQGTNMLQGLTVYAHTVVWHCCC